MANTNGNARQHSVRMMTPKRSGEYLSDSFDGLSGSKLAERDDESKDCVRRSNAHSAIKDITQTLASFCLKPDLYGRNLWPKQKKKSCEECDTGIISADIREMKQQDDQTATEYGISLPKWSVDEVCGEKYHHDPFIKPAHNVISHKA